MTDLSRAIAVKPIITYPREAQVGKTYLMTIDLQPEDGFEWQYEEEEYPIYCRVDSDLFSSKAIGDPVIVLHRFGGNYGEARFLLTAAKENQGNIRVYLINSWGVPIKSLKLEQIQVKSSGETSTETVIERNFATISTSFSYPKSKTIADEVDEQFFIKSEKEISEASKTLALVLTAISVEYEAVRSHLRDIQEVIFQGVIYERGIFIANGKLREVVIGEVGIGGIRAAIAIYQAINHFKPDVLLFVGIAGGIKDVALGDVVAVTKAYNYESGKVEGEFKPRPSVALTSYRMHRQAREESQKTDWLRRLTSLPRPLPRVLVAPIASGDKVIASRQSSVFELLRSYYADAVAVDMESYGVLEAASTYAEVDTLVIRGIADLIDDQKTANTSGLREIAALHASAFAFEILAKFKGDRSSVFKTDSTNIATRLNRFNRNIQPTNEDVAEANRQANYIADLLKDKIAVSNSNENHFSIAGMSPADCPAWEYADHPKRKIILKERTEDILVQLYQQQLNFVEYAADTRPIHGYLFSQLAPREHLYYAGHYRGENFPCLKDYYAGIEGESSIGFPPSLVEERMEKIGQWVREGIKVLDATHQFPDAQVSPDDKLLNTVAFACAIFVEVLRVHPYVNGNGHAARFILWAILGKYGYWPKYFPIEPRPNHPQYAWAIGEYLKGNMEAFENYILMCIAG